MRAAVVLAVVGGLLGGCRDEHSAEDDREYHGGPSSRVCGKRWSHDVTSFYCDGPKLRVDELRPFTNVRSMHIADAVVTRGAGARLESVTDLGVNRSTLDTALLVETFPRVRSLLIDNTATDVGALRSLDQLSFLLLHQIAVADAASIAAIPGLKTLMLNFVPCGEPGCDLALARQIRTLRPELEIKVNGDVLR
jgi:hypothetical protein